MGGIRVYYSYEADPRQSIFAILFQYSIPRYKQDAHPHSLIFPNNQSLDIIQDQAMIPN